MACSDRQLQQSQIEAGFQNQRTGVARGIRPFSGDPTPENIADYLNREVYPVLKQARDKINDTYLLVTDNAPSGNPLSHYFSDSTVNADPTPGFIRLDNATQNLATTIRVSQSNGRLVDVAPWLDVMAGSATTPLGAVTLTDSINPGRFVRWDLISMTDQGAYWDLVVSPIESSHPNPFVKDRAVVLGFIPGVASSGSGGAVVGPRAIHITSMAGNVTGSITNATNSILSSGTVFVPELTSPNFSLNNVSFRASGQSLLGVARLPFRAGTLAAYGNDLSFSNANNVSFGQATSTFGGVGQVNIITASAGPTLAFVRAFNTAGALTGDQALNVTQLLFSNNSNLSWQISTSNVGGLAIVHATVAASSENLIAAGTQTAIPGTVVFSNSNNVSFTMSGSSRIVASVTVAASSENLIAAGGSTAGPGTIVFSNSNGVSFGLNGSTVTGSYARELGLVSHVGGNQVASVTRLAFSNASNVTWSLSTAVGAVTVLASVAAAAGGGIAAAAGTQTGTSGTVVFADSNGLVFGMSGSSQITASYTVPTHTLAIAANGGAGISNGTFAFSDSNGIGFGRNVSTMTASFDGVRRVVGGISAINGSSAISFSDANNVSFGISSNVGTPGNIFVTASASAAATRELGIVSHIGGNVVSSVSRLAFSNASNVTFSLSTAAGAATLIASVDAGGGGGVNISGGTQLVTSGTLVFSSSNGIGFGISGSSRLTATYDAIKTISVGGSSLTNGQLVISASNGVSFGLNGSTLTASVSRPPNLSFYRNGPPTDNFDVVAAGGGNTSQLWVTPFGVQPFPADMTANTMDILAGFGMSTNSTGSWAFTLRGGVYTLANSTQLSRVNSFSFSFSSTTQASGARSSAFAGVRWIQLSTSNWSSSPVFSQGVQYWYATNAQTAGLGILNNWIHKSVFRINGASAYLGTFGVNNGTATFGSRVFPMGGVVATTSPPVSIGSANFINGEAANSGLIPEFQFRDAVHQ